jgi:hypothetical protein
MEEKKGNVSQKSHGGYGYPMAIYIYGKCVTSFPF